MIIPPSKPAPLWKKIYLHARGAINQRVTHENAANWVTVPYKLVEHYRAMAYAIVQTPSVDPQIRAFVYNYTQFLEAAATAYLTNHYGTGIFAVNKGITEEAYQHFYRALAAHQQKVNDGHFEQWEIDQHNQDGSSDE